MESHRPSGAAGDKENFPPPVIKEEIWPHKSDKYGAISLLDDDQEEEKWSERASVITALDHQVSLVPATPRRPCLVLQHKAVLEDNRTIIVMENTTWNIVGSSIVKEYALRNNVVAFIVNKFKPCLGLLEKEGLRARGGAH